MQMKIIRTPEDLTKHEFECIKVLRIERNAYEAYMQKNEERSARLAANPLLNSA